ncbi:Insect cuticle protein [Trinorchestia longiramus]|nr:Insect cuticle protein [Trinorchestia longiramus]
MIASSRSATVSIAPENRQPSADADLFQSATALMCDGCTRSQEINPTSKTSTTKEKEAPATADDRASLLGLRTENGEKKYILDMNLRDKSVLENKIVSDQKFVLEFLVPLLILGSLAGVKGSEYPDRECCDSAPPPPPNYHTVTPFPSHRLTTPKGAPKALECELHLRFVSGLEMQPWKIGNLEHFTASSSSCKRCCAEQLLETPLRDPAPSYQPAPRPSYQQPSYPDKPPKYAFDYAVQDAYSGVNFNQQEKRDGYNTQGAYYVALPDGRTQKVTYYVDGDSGYVAQVEYEGEAQYPQPRKGYQAPQPSYSPAPKPSYG